MTKALVLLIPAILLSACDFSEGLECYHCYSGLQNNEKGIDFVPCNTFNLTASNTMVCPSSSARCVYEEVEIQATKTLQTWRTCSNGILDPCDPNNLPPGVKMLKCSHCGTDRCNLHYNNGGNKDPHTFNINMNINLYIRQ